MFQQSLSKCTARIKTCIMSCIDDHDYYVVELREIPKRKQGLFSSLKKYCILASPRPPAHFIKRENNPLGSSNRKLPPSGIN